MKKPFPDKSQLYQRHSFSLADFSEQFVAISGNIIQQIIYIGQ